MFLFPNSISAASSAKSSLFPKPSPPASFSSNCAPATSVLPWSLMSSAAFSASSPSKTSSNNSSAKFTMNSMSSSARSLSPMAPSFSTPRSTSATSPRSTTSFFPKIPLTPPSAVSSWRNLASSPAGAKASNSANTASPSSRWTAAASRASNSKNCAKKTPPSLPLPRSHSKRIASATPHDPPHPPTLPAHSPRPLAGPHSRLPSHPHRSRRSRRTNAWRRRRSRPDHRTSPFSRPRSAAPRPIWPLPIANCSRQSRPIPEVPSARAPRHLRTLSRHAPTCFSRAPRLRLHRDATRRHLRASPRPHHRPPRQHLQPIRPRHSQFRSRPSAHHAFFNPTWLAPRLRPRRRSELHPSRRDARRCARRHSHPHGSRRNARRTIQRLRAHRPRQGPLHPRGPRQPRPTQRAHPHHHHSRPAVRYPPRWHHRHRNHFFLARTRTPHRASHLFPRLPAPPGLHPRHRSLLRPRQSPHRRRLRLHRSPGAPVMNASKHLPEFLRHSLLARIGFAIVCILVFAALFAPWISPANPSAQNLAARLQPPSHSHWMGTDELGRDILSRALYGARISLFVSICVVLGCGSIGLLLGMLAGYAGGYFDRVVNLLLINAFLSFPGVLLAIAFAAFFGPGF